MDSPRTTNRLLLVIAILLGTAALKLAQPVFIPLLLTVLLVYVMDPLVSLLAKRLPLWLSTLITVLLILGLFFGLSLLLRRDIVHFGTAFPRFQDEIIRRVEIATAEVERTLGAYIAVDTLEELRGLPVGQWMLSALRSTTRFISEFLLIFFFAIILLLGKHTVISKILAVFSHKKSLVPGILRHIDAHLRIFLGIKALSSLVVGAGTSGILAAFGVEFAVMWGFLTFIVNFIPTLGPIASVAAPVIISMVQYPTLLEPLLIAGILAVLHLGVSSLVEPKFMGRHLNLSFFVIFLSLFFWGWLWGPPGVLLAVPVTTSLKIMLERIPATSRFALLLESARRRRPLISRHGDKENSPSEAGAERTRGPQD